MRPQVPDPGGGVAAAIIAVFHAAKVELPADSRVAFTLTTPFTFDVPPATASVEH